MPEAKDFILGNYPADFGTDAFDPTGNIDDQAAAASLANVLSSEKASLDEFARVTACFRTGEGRAFLDWARAKTVDQPAFFPENYPLGAGGQIVQLDASQQGMIREGQNMVYREIVRMMDAVDKGPSPELQARITEKE